MISNEWEIYEKKKNKTWSMLKLSSETKCLEKKKNSIDEWTTDCKIQAEIPLKKKKTDSIN